MRSPIVPTLLALACLAPAADVSWQGAPGDKAPPGWSLASVATDAKVRWLDGELVIEAPHNRRALAAFALDAIEASDEKPLRVSAVVSATGTTPLKDYPALLGLEWEGGGTFAVGLGNDPRLQGEHRRGWVMWSSGGKATTLRGEGALYEDECPSHLRLVVTAKDVAAYASRDGWSWQRIGGVERSALGAASAPKRMVLGRGRVTERPGFDADPPGDGKPRVCSYRYGAIRVEQNPADLPSSLIRTYAKQESLEDTREAIAAPGRISAWRMQGPMPWPRNGPESVLPAEFTTQGDWKPLETQERVIQLSKLMPAPDGDHLRWLTGSIMVAETGWLRILFDGMRETVVYVDGRQVAIGDRTRDGTEPDRQTVSVPVRAGAHVITLGVRSRGASAVSIRTENGDPQWRLALLKRMAVDFPDDGELAQNGPFEISRLWEGLGFARAAVEALVEVAKREAGEQAERALVERARLYRNLRDEPAAAAEIAELTRRWGDGDSADKLSAFVRTAQLWQRLDVPDRALGALEDALKIADLPVETRLQLGVERARLRLRQGDALACAAELRTAAEALPEKDGRRFGLLVAAAHRELSVGKGVAQRLIELTKTAVTPAQFRLLAGLQAVRNDEENRLELRRMGSKLAPDSLDVLAIDVAESLVAAKDEAGAVAAYRRAVVQLGGAEPPADAKLPTLRAAALRAALSDRPGGKAMLAVAGTAGTVPPPPRWKMAGPVSDANWRAYNSNLVDPAKVDLGKPVEGKAWTDPAPEAVSGDSINLNVPDNTVTYFYGEIDSAEERRTVFSCGADDCLTVWLNGKRLYQDRDMRGLSPDSILIGARLAKGRNRILAMVHNGGGPSGFQFRFRAEPWPGAELGELLRQLASAPEVRPRIGQALAQLVEGCVGSEQWAEAEALLRAVVRCWPDDPALQMRVLRPVLWDSRFAANPELIREAVTWSERLAADRVVQDVGQCRGLRQLAGDRLLDAGAFAAALARLHADALAELDPLEVARILTREGDLWRRTGYPRLAQGVWTRARVQASADGGLQAEIDRRQWELRQIRGDTTVPNTLFDVGQLMRSIDRASESGDSDRAAADLQKLIELGRDQSALLAGGRLRGAGAWAAGRLRSLDGKILASWRDRWDARSTEQLSRAGDDPVRLERVLERFPVGPTAIAALTRLSEIYAGRGWWQLSLGSVQRLLVELPSASPDRARAFARAAHAAAHLGDRQQLAAYAAELERIGKPVSWDGADLPAKEILPTFSKLLPVPRPDPEAKALALDLRFEAIPPTASLRADGGLGLHQSHGAVLADGLLLVADPEGLRAVDAVDGRLRWVAQDSGLVTGGGNIATMALAASMPVVADGRVIVRVKRGNQVLDSYEIATGRRLWSSEDLPELQGLAPASLPAAVEGRVYALFASPSSCLAVAIDLASGSLLWSTSIGGGLPRQPISEGVEMLLSGQAPAPCLAGRELFLCTDAGLVASLDAGSGTLLWLHAYPRSAVSPYEQTTLQKLLSRGAGAIVADGKRVIVHPRDSLGLFALDRGNGTLAWMQELSEARLLAGAAQVAGEGRILLQGTDVRCLDATTGAQRWRWLPGADADLILGSLAVGADVAWVGTQKGLTRLSLADGAAKPVAEWKGLGISDAPAVITIGDGGVVACGDGRVAVLRPEGKAVRGEIPPRFLPGLLPSTGAKAAPPGTKDAVPATAWYLPLPGGAQNLIRPSGAKDGETYAVAAGRLFRLDAVAGTLIWQTPCPEVRSVSFSPDAIAVASLGAMTVFDRATGSRRWTAQVDTSLTRLIRNPWEASSVTFTAEGVTSYWFNDWWYAVRDAHDGHLLTRGRANGQVMTGLVQGGRLHLVTFAENKLKVEIRDPQNGAIEDTVPLDLGVAHGIGAIVLDGGQILIASDPGGVIWTPDGRKVLPVDVKLHEIWAAWEEADSRLVILGRHHARILGLVIDRSSGKLILSDDLWQWGRDWQERLSWIPRGNGGQILRAVDNREGKNGILARDLAGKELGFWAPLAPHLRRVMSGVGLGDRSLWLSHLADGRQQAMVLDGGGTQVGEGSVLGGLQGALVQPVLAGGVVIYGTDSGIGGLLPSAILPAVDAALPSASREVASLAVQLRSAAVPIQKLEAKPVIDGQADDWEGEPVIEVGAATGWREIDRGATPPTAPLRLRLGWTDAGLGLHAQAPVGTSRVVLAFHFPDWNFNSWPVPVTVGFSGHDGRPDMGIIAGSFTGSDKPEARPEWRMLQAPDGLRLEYFLPWAALRQPRQNEPTRIGVCAEYSDSAGRRGCLEWGEGLSRGIHRESLMLVTLDGNTKKAKAAKPTSLTPKPKGK